MSAARRGRSNRDRMRRTSQRRKLKKTWLIVCEGRETERNYLDKLKREESVKKHFAITVIRGKGGARSQIVSRAVDEKRTRENTPNRDSPDKVVCVLDTESLQNPQARGDLAAARDSAKNADIALYLSNPAFEVWFLAHFQRTSRQFRDCDAVIVELTKEWNAAFGQAYDKTDDNVYKKLASRTEEAIENARNVVEHDHGDKRDIADCNSSTEVYRLVEKLFSGQTD